MRVDPSGEWRAAETREEIQRLAQEAMKQLAAELQAEVEDDGD